MSDAPLVLGVDASTTACKAIVWDAQGRAVSEGRRAIALENPAPDAYEQDAETWWTATTGAVRDAVTRLGEGRIKDIAALCIANQRETCVVTDERGVPLHRALVWMDSRCRQEVGTAAAVLGADRIHHISGKPACTTPSFYKLLF